MFYLFNLIKVIFYFLPAPESPTPCEIWEEKWKLMEEKIKLKC